MEIEDLKLAQGPAKIASAADKEKDAQGITYPNLHRRIDNDSQYTDNEVSYSLSVNGVASYRSTSTVIHNEQSDEVEIP